ncbi:hypothetical protein [Humibacter albus]|uniref:hypothetical protein n=1 Tax=Humibacter albus TaxID=427754 RepID=UPI0012F85DD7|nr:hypothetical protein [Humibacter albus]
MPLRRWMLVPALAASLALPLSGCTPTTPKPTPTKSASHAPLFSSDEEALAAATKAYAAYQAVTDEVLHDGGESPFRYRKVAAGSALRDALTGAKDMRESGLHTVGKTTFDSAKLQSRSRLAKTRVQFYVCDDVSGTDLVDASDVSQVTNPKNRRTPWEVEIQFSTRSHGLVYVRDFWSGDDFCAQ